MKDWTIGVRISAGFAVILTISALLGIFATYKTADISRKTEALSSNYFPSVLALSDLQANTEHRIALLLRLVDSSDAQEIARLDAQISALNAANEKDIQFYESTPFTPEEAAVYAEAKATRAQYLDLFATVRKVGQSTDAKEIARAQKIFDQQLSPVLEKYENQIKTLVELNKAGAGRGMASIQDAGASATRGIILGIILSVGLAIPIVLFIVRGITRAMKQAVATLEKVAEGDLTVSLDVQSKDEVGQMATALNTALAKLRSTLQDVAAGAASGLSGSQELAAAADAIASGAQEQAASLEETSASLEQITATVRQSADNASQANQLASGSRDSAEAGQEIVIQAVNAMAEINVASSKIADIISTIDEIAFQTNLLAVNAAVEAARAGEEGRGFAVVATEVRSLAQRSAGAAKEIKTLIQDSLRKVDRGTELVNKSGETLRSIVTSVKQVTDIVAEMAAASREQSTGVEQVNTAMTQMDQVTQSNAAQTEQLSSTAQALSEQSLRLTELVGTFTLSKQGSSRAFPTAGRVATHLRPAMPVQPRVSAHTNAGNRTKSTASGTQASGKSSIALAVADDDASFEEF